MVERNSTKTTNIVRTSKGNQFAITGRRIGTKTGTTDICYYFVHCLYDLNSDFDAGIRTKRRWYARKESNLHSRGNRILNPARLPIPPRARQGRQRLATGGGILLRARPLGQRRTALGQALGLVITVRGRPTRRWGAVPPSARRSRRGRSVARRRSLPRPGWGALR